MLKSSKDMAGPDGLSQKDECSGKKCCCKTFSELEFKPPVVMITPTYADASVQVGIDEFEPVKFVAKSR